ncbi:hypothetical protein cypCar_00031759, partial [Cyprinus carpio]
MSSDESSSKLTFYLIIALVSVSTFFLTFIIILAVRFCRRRKPRLLFDGARHSQRVSSSKLRRGGGHGNSVNDIFWLFHVFYCKQQYWFRVAAEMFGLLFFVLMARIAYGDLSYSFPEEMKRGSVIGNIAKDLGLDVNRLSSRKARIDAE